MILTISPAKTLDFNSAKKAENIEYPVFIDEADYLVGKLKKYSPKKIKNLMSISDNLADLNFERFQNWDREFDADIAREAIHVFKGDVYQGLDIDTLEENEIQYLEDHLIILSGLYGALKPQDSMLPYRLEMGSSMKVTPSKNNLYKFWGNKITDYFNRRLEENNTDLLINLASNEYFKAINQKNLNARIIVPEFKDLKDGNYKMISFFAKKARGTMLRYIAQNNITEAEHIKSFNEDGYYYNNLLSTKDKWVFTRDH